MALVAVGLSGCSQEPEEPPAPAATSAARVCDGAFDAPAAKALERIGGTEGFYEAAGETSDGERRTFAFSRAAASLRSGPPKYTGCAIRRANAGKDSRPISFWIEARERPPRKEDAGGEPDSVAYYPLGVHAETRDGDSALLFFRCRTGNTERSYPYLAVQMVDLSTESAERTTSRDRMTVLASFSRTLADSMGCADEARLPQQVPAPGTPW
ncbi:hypothetical protein ACFVU3_02550 [Streptomyces sp. NPDC058052]|uniref:hypothetical protein n=1 Tax=Streptomyces sp. NPDC058052 TaxID=3346316 RepID=UPI0036E61A8C